MANCKYRYKSIAVLAALMSSASECERRQSFKVLELKQLHHKIFLVTLETVLLKDNISICANY